MRKKNLVRGLAAVVAMACLAACSGTDDSGGPTTAALNRAEAKEFRGLVGLSDSDVENLKGKDFKLSAILPLSGGGASYGKDMNDGIELAIDQIERYVGLNVDYSAKDHKSGDPQAGVQTGRDVGISGAGALLASYYGVFGSLIPAIEQYKMLTFDPGGGTGNGLKGKPYFWGFRANTPDDPFAGLRYFAEKEPEKKKVSLVMWDAGDAYVDPIVEHLKESVADNGLTFGTYILSKIGATDYASVLSKLKDDDPDVVVLATYGTDTAYFMKDFASSGLDAQVLAMESLPDAAKIAGDAFQDMLFAGDYFDVNAPPNPLSTYMVDTYQERYDKKPSSFYVANYYEAALGMLQLAARVAASGGDINKGADLNAALEKDPTLRSVYGGDASTVGEITLDLETHDPTVRPVGLFRVTGDGATQLASWNIGGSDFKVLQ